MTETDDLNKMTDNESCNYEKERGENLTFRTDKLLEMCENIKMPEHKRFLVARRIMPVIKAIETPLHCYLIQNPRLQEKRENVPNISKTCKRGLEVLKDFCLPPVKPCSGQT